MNKKEKRAALFGALTNKVEEGDLIVIDSLSFPEKKTKEFARVMTNLNIDGKALVVTAEHDENVICSARNLPKVATTLSTTLGVYDIMNAKKLVLTKDAVTKIEEVFV